jgi:hypothetical protein
MIISKSCRPGLARMKTLGLLLLRTFDNNDWVE